MDAITAMRALTLASCDTAFGNRGDCDLGDPDDPCAHVCNNSERGQLLRPLLRLRVVWLILANV